MNAVISRLAAGPVSRRTLEVVVDQPLDFESPRLSFDVRGKNFRFRQNPQGSLQCHVTDSTTVITTTDRILGDCLTALGVHHGKAYSLPCSLSEFGGVPALLLDASAPREVEPSPGLQIELTLSSGKDKRPTFRAGQLKHPKVKREFREELGMLLDGTEAIFTLVLKDAGQRKSVFKKSRVTDWYASEWDWKLPEVGEPLTATLLSIEVAGRSHTF